MFDAAVAALVEVIQEVRPQVMVSYDDFGGYGHPDHMMAHRVATAAAAPPPRSPTPGGRPAVDGVEVLLDRRAPFGAAAPAGGAAEAPAVPFEVPASADDLGFVVDDELVTTVVHAPDQPAAKSRALAAHATQITVSGRSSRCPTTSASRCRAPSTFGWCTASGRPAGRRRSGDRPVRRPLRARSGVSIEAGPADREPGGCQPSCWCSASSCWRSPGCSPGCSR